MSESNECSSPVRTSDSRCDTGHPATEFVLVPAHLPSRIDVEPTIRCNYRCVMCQRTFWTRRAPDMTLTKFQRVCSFFPHLREVKIQGIGEPLLNRDLFAMISHAKALGSTVRLSTNASILHRDDNANRLLDSGVDRVHVSVDGGTRTTFEGIRVGADFETVVQNLSLLSSLRGIRKTPRLEIWTVALAHNIQELPQIVDIAQRTNVDMLHVQLVLNTFSYKPEVENRVEALQISSKRAPEELNVALKYASSRGVQMELVATKTYSSERPCHWPFDRVFISVEGDVVPCCVIADPRVVRFGNVFENTFEEIWRGKPYQEFRHSNSHA